MLFRKTLFLLISVLAFCTTPAQFLNWSNRQIATDYNNCTQGVKDSLGNWVIEPKYELIRYDYPGYIVGSGGKFGLLDENGKELIPMMYDEMYPLRSWSWWNNGMSNLYLVTSGYKHGVVDSTNRVIVPVQYEKIRPSNDSTILAGNGKTWEFYNLSGGHFAAPWKSRREPQSIVPHIYKFSRFTPLGFRYGASTDSGKIILKRKYFDIEGWNKTKMLMVSGKKTYGYCSLAGRMIWPMRFSNATHTNWRYSGEFRSVGYYGVGPAILHGQYGMINSTGDIVLPFRYTSIRAFNDYSDNDLWIVDSSGYMGVYDIQHGWKVPLKFSSMITVKTFVSNVDSTVTGLIVAEREHTYGAITTSGQIVIPFRYSEMIQLSDYDFIFSGEDSIMELILTGEYQREAFVREALGRERFDAIEELHVRSYVDPSPDGADFSVFTGHNGFRAYYDPRRTHDEISCKDTSWYFDEGKYYGRPIPDSVFLAAAFFVKCVPLPVLTAKQFTLFAAEILEENDSSLHSADFVRFESGRLCSIDNLVSQRKGSTYYITSYADLLKEDGTIIVSGDSVFEIEERHHGSDGALFFSILNVQKGTAAIDSNGRIEIPWSERVIGDYNKNYCWYEEDRKHDWNWSLVDLRTHQNILGKKTLSLEAHAIWDNITIVEDVKHGTRLFNCNTRTYFTESGFNHIASIGYEGKLFAVKTCNGNIGLMRADGTWACDTIYTSFTPVDFDTSFEGSSYIGEGGDRSYFYHHYVFYNNRVTSTINPQTGLILSQEQSTAILWKSCITPVECADVYKAVTDSFAFYWTFTNSMSFLSAAKDTGSFLPWHRRCITDSLFSPKRSEDDYRSYDEDYPCAFCHKRKAGWMPFLWTQNWPHGGYFMAQHKSDSLLSFFYFDEQFDFFSDDVERSWFSNVMLFKDGPHQLTIDSLFIPASDWRNLLINTVITYVNTHNNIRGDCHNPAAIPSMLSQSFLISPSGLMLFPHGFQENDEQLSITMPWKDVDSYLRPDLRSRLPMNEK